MSYRFLLIFILVGSVLFSQVNTERLRGDELSPGAHHDISLNTSFFGGNTDYSSLSGAYRLDYVFSNRNIFFLVDAISSRKNGEAIQNAGFYHVRYIQPIKANFLEFFAQREWDEFNSLSYRNLLGAGLRFEWILSDVSELAVGTGVMLEYQKYKQHISSDSYVRLTNYMSYQRILNLWKYQTINYFQPANFKNVSAISDHELTYSVSKTFSIILNVKAQYNTEIPSELKRLNYKVSQSFSWSF